MTIGIIVVTAIISFLAFGNRALFDKLKFNAYLIYSDKEWYRFITYGFLHANLMHLLINMFVFYSFGQIVETIFVYRFMGRGYIYYLLLYIGGIAFSTLFDFGRHKDDFSYNAVGASGAVSSVVFSSIILYPAGKIFLFFIPIGIPSPLFGIAYLAYSAYMGKMGRSNIGHNAHFWGAIFGIVFTIALDYHFLLAFIDHIF